ncbi:MAG: T9SS type A sorting domain-containing protein [Candidatus Kapabacteria bacterium]|nr:T9SS type A sorting domain-containing protein [Candidatus Kapabacteria bacterium]
MKKTILLLIILLSSNLFSNVHVGIGQKYSRIELAYADKAINPGDTVFIHAGNYSGYNGIVGLKGNANGWIVFTKYQNDSVSIAGNWQFQACEYIKIVNLHFKATAQSPGRLINVDNNGSCNTQSRFIKFDSCTFADVTDPNSITSFKFGGVDNFEVTNCVFTNMQVSGAFDFNVCHNGIIRGNRIENCLTGGHIKGGASDIVMERNIFINASKNGWVAFELGGDTGAQFYCPDDKFEVKNLKFYSNLVIGGDRGISLASATECKLINNTFYNCGQATLRFLTTSMLYPTLNANRIENNIFAFGASAYMNGGTQPANAASFSKNIYFSTITNPFNGPYWDTPDLDAMKDKNQMNLGSSAKMFVDGKNNDFHLIESSPAIGAGASETEPLFDFYGKPFNKNTRSIGAIEFLSPSELSISTNSINLPYQANSSATFSIKSNITWSASSNQTWLAIDKKNGTTDDIIKITASENTNVSPRSSTITISGIGLNNQYIIVNQDAGTSDVADIEYTNILFHPNPADNYIELNSDFGFSKIEIYNPLGMKILETEYQSKLDVSKLTTGIYFLKMNDKLIKFT